MLVDSKLRYFIAQISREPIIMNQKTHKPIYSPIRLSVLFLLLPVIFSVFIFSGCERAKPTKADRDEVRAVMEMRQKAIQNKDIDLYKQVIIPDYNDAGVNFKTLVEVMQANFDNNASIEFRFKRSMVDMSMNSARMVGQISYIVSGAEEPVYDQEITIFRRVNGQWKISGGIKVIPL